MANQTLTGIRLTLLNNTASGWTSSNPTLLKGEFGWESDTSKFKIGDGTTAWNDLEYADVNLVKYTDAVDNLTSSSATAPLSANQGRALKALIDAISAGDITVPVATDSEVGGVLSGGDITVDGSGECNS